MLGRNGRSQFKAAMHRVIPNCRRNDPRHDHRHLARGHRKLGSRNSQLSQWNIMAPEHDEDSAGVGIRRQCRAAVEHRPVKNFPGEKLFRPGFAVDSLSSADWMRSTDLACSRIVFAIECPAGTRMTSRSPTLSHLPIIFLAPEIFCGSLRFAAETGRSLR